MVELLEVELLPVEPSNELSLVLVSGPNSPEAGVILFATWNAVTALAVAGPK